MTLVYNAVVNIFTCEKSLIGTKNIYKIIFRFSVKNVKGHCSLTVVETLSNTVYYHVTLHSISILDHYRLLLFLEKRKSQTTASVKKK